MTNYPALTLLLQGYLNLDWPDEYGNPWAAVDDFLASEPLARQLRSEIDEILAGNMPDDYLRALVVDTIGSGYLPEANGWTIADWLRALANRASDGS
jgi:hypothetical protein